MQPLAKLLTRQRTACATVGISKKRVFESVAKIISEDQLSLSYDEIFTHLIGREKLGSTGLGQGIAIPHCRIENCTQPMGTLVTLSEPVDYDSPDDQPVDLIFALLVPQEAQQQHLDTLAEIASLFSQPAFCQQLRAAKDADSLFAAAISASMAS